MIFYLLKCLLSELCWKTLPNHQAPIIHNQHCRYSPLHGWGVDPDSGPHFNGLKIGSNNVIRSGAHHDMNV